MKISLIENGLDSLKKGYDFLKAYEELENSPSTNIARYSRLKDAILSMQHGIEILFKFLLRDKNEVLLYSDINAKLRQAFVRRRNGEIQELFEDDGVHTVTFRESLERVRDICGIDISERLSKKLLKVERWRNAIIHSAVSLPEQEVFGVLSGLMRDLDKFFSASIGDAYIYGHGRLELERAYEMFIGATKHIHPTKLLVVERLIKTLKNHRVGNITSPGVFLVEDFDKANGILQEIQGGDIVYGCDLANYHCSGSANILGGSSTGPFRVYTDDNRSFYDIGLAGIVVYVPDIDDDLSPLVFIYSKGLEVKTANPYIHKTGSVEVQEGIVLSSGVEIWDADDYNWHRDLVASDDPPEFLGGVKWIHRFLTPGCSMFLNIQNLEFGNADDLIHDPRFQTMLPLRDAFEAMVEKSEK